MFSRNVFLERLLSKVVEGDTMAETACCEFPADAVHSVHLPCPPVSLFGLLFSCFKKRV
jgi:hypothetical protein